MVSDSADAVLAYWSECECGCSLRELPTVLTTTMTTVGLSDAATYMTIELVSCPAAPSTGL